MMPEGLDRIRNARILVVEDSVSNQTLARDLLLHAGCHVDLAQNGREALEAIESASEPYDAVLMDLQMPIMDGLETTGVIRGELALNDLPIIATTANSDRKEQQLCLAAGANDCLPKPFHIHDLYAILIRWVKPVGEASARPDEKEKAKNDPGDALVAAEVDLPAEIAGLDIEHGMARMGQRRELYAGQLIEFADTNAGSGEAVTAAATRGDLDRVRFIVHGIRSTAGNIGADELSGAAADVETAIIDGDDAVAERLAAFLTKLEGVIAAIRAAEIVVRRRPSRQNAGFDRDEAERLTGSLLTLLEDQDLGAQQAFHRLAAILDGRGHDATLKRLGEHLDALEFSDARQILARVGKDILD